MTKSRNKTSKALFGISLIIFAMSFALPSFALKYAEFPNEHPLQPLPENVRPNISNNIQATGTFNPAAFSGSRPADQAKPAGPAATTGENVPAEKTAGVSPWYWLAALPLVIALFFFLIFRGEE